jgi:predicted nuclease of restriction endonuclease-like (RecB) superfamily
MKLNKEIPIVDSSEQNFIKDLKQIILSARDKAYSAINFAQVEANWLLGKRLIEQEQQGTKRAEYGKYILVIASQELTKIFGKGFSTTNLKNFRKFYQLFGREEKGQAAPDLLLSPKGQALPDQLFADQHQLALLSWTHYERLIRIENKKEREWYMKEASEQSWSYRTLDRNISTQYYRRLLASQQKEPVINEMQKKTNEFQNDKLEFIKNPSVLEFLNLPASMAYTEKELEKALIDNLQTFLLELGKGYAFVERQQLVRTEISDFYVDLVFYNYILKCFFIIELKTDKITHQDIGQLDMYVRMYDDLKRGVGDNPTIGILLCTETDKVIARYSVLAENKQLFATKYMPYLPSEKELEAEIEKQKLIFQQRRENE